MTAGRNLRLGAVLSYVGIGCSILSGVLLTPLILRSLGQSAYGVYHMAGALIGYLSLLDLGFGEVISRYVSRYRLRRQEAAQANFLGHCVLFYGCAMMLSAAVGLMLWQMIPTLFGGTLSPEELATLKRVFLILLLNFTVTLPFSAFPSLLTAYEAFLFSRSLHLVMILLRFLMTIRFLGRGMGVYGLLLIEILLDLFMIVVQGIYLFGVLGVRVKLYRLDLRLLRQMLAFGFFLLLSSVVGRLQWQLGNMLLGALKSPEAVALLSLALQPVSYFRILSGVVAGLSLPRAVQTAEENASPEALTAFMVRVGRLQLMICGFLFIGFICVGDTFLRLWAGAEYGGAYPICLVLMGAVILPSTLTTGVYLLEAKNLHRRRAVVSLLLALGGIIPSVLLILRFDALGAALGTALSLAACTAATGIELKRRLAIRMGRFCKRLTAGILPVLVACGLLGLLLRRLLPHNAAGMLTLAVVLTLFYLPSLWFFGLTQTEKHQLRW